VQGQETLAQRPTEVRLGAPLGPLEMAIHGYQLLVLDGCFKFHEGGILYDPSQLLGLG
jgi:hypothetical protein